jgi:hypothetical protein
LEGTSIKIIDAVTPAAHAWDAVGRFSEDAIKAFKQDVAQAGIQLPGTPFAKIPEMC